MIPHDTRHCCNRSVRKVFGPQNEYVMQEFDGTDDNKTYYLTFFRSQKVPYDPENTDPIMALLTRCTLISETKWLVLSSLKRTLTLLKSWSSTIRQYYSPYLLRKYKCLWSECREHIACRIKFILEKAVNYSIYPECYSRVHDPSPKGWKDWIGGFEKSKKFQSF